MFVLCNLKDQKNEGTNIFFDKAIYYLCYIIAPELYFFFRTHYFIHLGELCILLLFYRLSELYFFTMWKEHSCSLLLSNKCIFKFPRPNSN